MSLKYLRLTWNAVPGILDHDLIVMLALGDWADTEGWCWPSCATIFKSLFNNIDIRRGDRVENQYENSTLSE